MDFDLYLCLMAYHNGDEIKPENCEVYGYPKSKKNFMQLDVVFLEDQYQQPNSNQVAKLVSVNLMTRVVVDKDATDEEIIQASREHFRDIVNGPLGDHIDEIVDDEECPVEDNEVA